MFRFVLIVIMSVSLYFSPRIADAYADAGRADEIADYENEEDKLAAEALRKWFEGNEEEAEGIFRSMTDSATKNPVPYHALSVMLYDRKNNYPEAKKLLNIHRNLMTEGHSNYLAVMPVLEEFYKKGDVRAQLIFGRAMLGGLSGRGRNLVKAMLAFRRASDGGYASAQKDLGFMYEVGLGVAQDKKEAERLYSLAASNADPSAMSNLAVIQLNDASLTEKDFAASLLERAAGMHYAEAEMLLAQMRLNGLYYPKDEALALRHYEKAAEYGASEAMNILAGLYEEGRIAEKSPELAVKWYREAAANGDHNSLFRLGVLYYTGNMVKEDHSEAYSFFKKSAELGNPSAWFNVALLCINGDGVERDPQEAKFWFEQSARIGNARAQANLGVMYANGDGVTEDYEEAYFWLTLAKLCGEENVKGLESIAEQIGPEGVDRAQRRAETALKRIRRRNQEEFIEE